MWATPIFSLRRFGAMDSLHHVPPPPTFVVFGTRAELLAEDYQRYLANGLREAFSLPGVPLRLQLRGTRNPFAEG